MSDMYDSLIFIFDLCISLSRFKAQEKRKTDIKQQYCLKYSIAAAAGPSSHLQLDFPIPLLYDVSLFFAISYSGAIFFLN